MREQGRIGKKQRRALEQGGGWKVLTGPFWSVPLASALVSAGPTPGVSNNVTYTAWKEARMEYR